MSEKPSNTTGESNFEKKRLTLRLLPAPAKALTAALLLTLALAMTGAVGQIIVHDIIPTFFSENESKSEEYEVGEHADAHRAGKNNQEEDSNAGSMVHGDLFADIAAPNEAEEKAFYENDQLIWTLKWTHIHLFGMNMIFILLCAVTYLLDMSSRSRTFLIVLPFVGVFIDIAAMWFKNFVSPAFFWLHVPGGGVFGVVFLFVFFRANWEMFRR